jgi:hypothetical protein
MSTPVRTGRTWGWLTSLNVVFGLTGFALAETATDPIVEPVTLFQDNQLTACGVRATFAGADVGGFDFLLIKLADDKSEWAVKFAPANGKVSHLANVSLEAAGFDTAVTLKPNVSHAAGEIDNRGPLEEAVATSLVVGLMVGGGTFKLTDKDGTVRAFTVPGPLPHEVRSGYLACAGDLFRP